MNPEPSAIEATLTAPGAPFEVVEGDVLGVPTRLWRSAPTSLIEIWQGSRAHGDRDYLVYRDERFTYAEAHAVVERLAARLAADYGLGQGDRFAIAMRNYPEWVLAFWAGISLGAVAVPLNAWWTGPELAYGLSDSASKVLFADDERLERLAPHLGDLSLAGVVGARTDAGKVAFKDLIETNGGDGSPPSVTVEPDDDVTILYTSGTTGRPKGAVGTHRNIGSFLFNLLYAGAARAAASAAAASGATPASPPPAPATVLTFPLFHVGGLQSHLVPYTAFGGKLALMYKWDADEAVDIIEREHITAFSGVPTTAFQLLERATARGVSLGSLEGLSSGATLVPPELVRRVDEQFTSRVAPTNGYGLTETSGAMVANSGADYVARPDSVGQMVAPVNEMRIVAPESGTDVDPGGIGEIWFKGPSVVRGYWNNKEASAESFTDGWFHTGDLGFIDADGYLHVVDRIKDVVIRGGENIYAVEVEAALFEHPDVLDAAIVGLPDPTMGEEVAAIVRLRPGSGADADALRRHVGERLAVFKVPTTIELRDDELPRNAAGKVLKRQLREQLQKA